MIGVAAATSPRIGGELAYGAGRLRAASERAFNQRPYLAEPGKIATEAARATSEASPYAIRYGQSYPQEQRRRGGHLSTLRSR